MNEHSGHRMPKWLLVLCFGAPVLGLVAWLLIPGSGASIIRLLPYSLFLFCPLSHFLLMPLMHKTSKNHHDEVNVDELDSKNDSSCH